MKKILFDATVLVDGEDLEEERRGIYFVAKNLLCEFNKLVPGHVVLYASSYKIAGLKKLKDVLELDNECYRPALKLSIFFYKIVLFFRRKRMDNTNRPFFRKMWALGILFFSIISSILYFFRNCAFRLTDEYVFFSPRTSAPWFINRNKNIKKYIVLHDLIPYLFPQNNSLKYWGWFGYLMRTINKNDVYFANSDTTKKDFISFSKKIDERKIVTIYLAAEQSFYPHESSQEKKALQKKYGIPYQKKFVFALGSLEPRKNLVRIAISLVEFVEKNSIEDLVLVVGGGSSKNLRTNLLENGMTEMQYNRYVFNVGYIDDRDLPLMYSFAAWFVFTSQYEGFGLPVLEAMQCGCPVITSNNSSLPEVVGDAGIVIDWNSVEQHVNAYETLYNMSEMQKKNIREKVIARSKLFSWERTSKKMIKLMFGEDCV